MRKSVFRIADAQNRLHSTSVKQKNSLPLRASPLLERSETLFFHLCQYRNRFARLEIMWTVSGLMRMLSIIQYFILLTDRPRSKASSPLPITRALFLSLIHGTDIDLVLIALQPLLARPGQP